MRNPKQKAGLWTVLHTLGVMLFALLCVQAAAVLPPEEAATLRVLTYNIHHGEGADGQLDLERIAEVIRAARPDIVALQEVDVETERTGNVDQAAVLSRLTEMGFVFGGNLDLEGGSYGNAVLSRFPVVAHRNVALPNPTGAEPRGALEVKLEIGQDTVAFIATHFDHSDRGNRMAGARAINRMLDEVHVLAGDLNAVPQSDVLDVLRQTWGVAGEDEKLLTSPAGTPTRQIDYVLYRPQSRWEVTDVRVIEEAVASDHRPVLAVLTLRDN